MIYFINFNSMLFCLSSFCKRIYPGLAEGLTWRRHTCVEKPLMAIMHLNNIMVGDKAASK